MAIRSSLVLFFVILFSAVSARAQDLVKVPVQIPSITPAVSPFAVARDRGYYRQEGLDVQLVVIPSALGMQAMLGGNVKFATAGGAGLLPILRGAPARYVFTSFSRPMFWLYARPEIRSVDGLKGKKVGVSGIGSGPDSLLREISQKIQTGGRPRRGDPPGGLRHGALFRATSGLGGRGDAFHPRKLDGPGCRFS